VALVQILNEDTPGVLDEKSLADDAKSLATIDKDMAQILQDLGVPPLWSRQPGFSTLVRIILEQQVSLTSAEAMFRRLNERIKPLTPMAVLEAGPSFLRSFGITRQKASYFINVCEAIESGKLDLENIAREDDETAIENLTSVKGIGPWTAKIYLLMVLGRADVWPVGDVALATAVKHLKGMDVRPTQAELSGIAESWAPYRATAARMLWNYYLNRTGGN
jgi:DNA-3-methyladenine glycosylase II